MGRWRRIDVKELSPFSRGHILLLQRYSFITPPHFDVAARNKEMMKRPVKLKNSRKAI